MNSNEYADKFKLLSGMAMLLQSCGEEAELFDITYWYLPRLLPEVLGAIYLKNEITGQMSKVFAWPEDTERSKAPEPAACRSMLNGSINDVFEAKGLTCRECDCGTLCIPFRQDKESFGLFCLRGKNDQKIPPTYKGLAFITTEYLSLAVSNIRLRNKLMELSIRDPLTGLFNRRYMNEVTAREIRKAKRSGASLGMIMADIDHFKRFNDTFGHDAGDEVLKKVAQVLVSGLRSEDIVCRFGGEEFFIFITTGGYKDCLKRAQDLRRSVEALHLHWGGQSLGSITSSFGVAVFPDHGSDIDKVIKRGDQALFLAKETGRNKVVGADELTGNH